MSGPASALEALGRARPVRLLGEVGGESLRIDARRGVLELTLAELGEAHGALRALFP